MKNIVIQLLSLFAIPGIAYSQSIMNKVRTEYLLIHSPAFSIYKDNYFITGTTLLDKPTQYNSDIKFQFGFKQRLANRSLVWGSFLYLIYTQKSFWNIYQESSPFEETNYNPGFMLAKPIFRNDRLTGMLMLSIEHESNGRDSIRSRSWNYVGINYSHRFSSQTGASLKFFIPFGLSDNPDLIKYIGYGEAKFTWNIKEDRLILDVLGRKGAEWSTKGSLMTTFSVKPHKDRNLYLALQWFVGNTESLIEYEQSTNMLRLGVMIKPSFFRIY